MDGRQEDGFTLLEMIVVVAVLGLIAVLLLGRGPSRSPALDLHAGSDELTAFLRRARAEAIASDRDVSVSVRDDGRGYGIENGRRHPDTDASEAGEADPGADASDAADAAPSGGAARTLPARVAVIRRADGRLPPPITFHPDGSATGGHLVLGEDGRQRTVDVNWLTGAVSAS